MTAAGTEPAEGVDLGALAELASTLARAAGTRSLEMRDTARINPERKSSISDLVTEADRAVEALIVDGISRHRGHDAVLGEEGARRTGTSGLRWVIDPIDGTTNYVQNLPGYSVSIAVESARRRLVGVVYDPKADECFVAIAGRGAHCNGRVLHCSTRSVLAESVLGTGFAYHAELRAHQANVLVHLLPRVANIRRLGSAALDLAYVGAGRLDGYWEAGLNPWDRAAGALIAAEAGAVVSGLDRPEPSSAMTIAAPVTLHGDLTDALRLAYGHLGLPPSQAFSSQ